MSTTNHIDDQADAFVHDLLDATDCDRVQAHCETCRACQQAVADARKRLALLQAVPPTEAPPQLVETTMRHLDDTMRRRARLKKRTLAIFFGVAAAAVLLLTAAHVYTQRMTVSPYDLAVFGQSDLLAASSASVRVRLIDRTTNRPVAGVPVRVELDRGGQITQLAQFTTDAAGSGEPTFTLPDQPCEFELRVRAQTPGGDEVVARPLHLRRTWKVMVSTDKPVYQPGQTIHVRALALRSLDRQPAKQTAALLTLHDPKGNLIFKHESETSKFGITATDCPLANEILEGTYVLACKIGDTESRRGVEVRKYVLPKFKVEVKLDRPYYHPKEKAKVVVQADYFFGKPVADAEVVVEVRGDLLLHEEKLRTDAMGHGEFEYAMPDEGIEWPLKFTANVTDTGGQKQSVVVERLDTKDSVRIDLVPENGMLVPNLPNTIYVLTTRVDGLPMSVRVKVADFDELHTDALGVGSFVMTPIANREVVLDVLARDDQGALLASQKVVVDPGYSGLVDFLLHTDKVVYRAGDTMTLTVRAERDQPIYVDVVKDGQTLMTRTIDIRQGRGKQSIDLPPDLCGTLQLCAYRFYDFQDMAEQRTRIVYVHPPSELKIATTLDRDEYRPGTGAKINFRVTDAKGSAVPGVLSIAAVDEAVFAVMPQRPGRETHFYTVDDGLLAAMKKLRPWSPEAQLGGDDESRERLQQALFATVESMNSYRRPPGYYRAMTQLPAHSLIDNTFDRKNSDFEDMRKYRLENLRLAWFGLLATILLIAYVGFWIIAERKTVVMVHFFGLFMGMPATFCCISNFGGSANNTFSYVGAKVGATDEPVRSVKVRPDINNLEGIIMTKNEEVDISRTAADAHPLKFSLNGLASNAPRVRDYFPETLEWQPHLITDDDGRASFDLKLADSITTWRLSASAVTADGRLGAADLPLKVFQPFFVDVNLPVSLTRGDELAVPVVVYNYLDKPQTVALSLTKAPWFVLLDDAEQRVDLAPGQVRSVAYRIRVEKAGEQELTVSARAGDIGDAVKRVIEVVPDGRRVEVVHNGTLDPDATQELTLPKNAIDGSGKAFVKIYPSGFSEVVEGLDGVFQIPHGCFEQTSSTTYPSVLALDYLKRTNSVVARSPDRATEADRRSPEARGDLRSGQVARSGDRATTGRDRATTAEAVEKQARERIHLGYQRLLSFEVSGGGFDWFGHAPANVQLTAYGLMEFQDMARVHDVDPALIERTRAWLLKQRRGDGSWLPTDEHHFAADQVRLTAYVAWAVFDNGNAPEYRARTRQYLLSQPPQGFDDPYALALMCNALLALDPTGGDAAPYLDRLETLKHLEPNMPQASWPLGKDRRTIYYGWGESGTVETTALAALAFLKEGKHPTSARQALAWLAAHKDAHGTWPSTQATVLALKALLAGTTPFGGDKERRFLIKLGNQFTQELIVPANQADVLQMIDLSKHLKAETQKLTIRETTGTKSAYQVAFRYHEPLTLAAAEDRPLKIEMKFDKETLKIGDMLTATATATNRTGTAAPMVMLELPIPVGCALSGDDFTQLVEKKVIARYERTPRGVLVYLTGLDKKLTLTYHLQATTPARGTTTPARVYEYYNPQQEGRSEQALLVVK